MRLPFGTLYTALVFHTVRANTYRRILMDHAWVQPFVARGHTDNGLELVPYFKVPDNQRLGFLMKAIEVGETSVEESGDLLDSLATTAILTAK